VACLPSLTSRGRQPRSRRRSLQSQLSYVARFRRSRQADNRQPRQMRRTRSCTLRVGSDGGHLGRRSDQPVGKRSDLRTGSSRWALIQTRSPMQPGRPVAQRPAVPS
jgi:hypothetical protein